jgi:hypothetical protein
MSVSSKWPLDSRAKNVEAAIRTMLRTVKVLSSLRFGSDEACPVAQESKRKLV